MNRAKGRNTFIFIDEIYLLFQHEYSANFLFTLWKRVRKYGAYCTGITQNVEDMLQSHTARTMLANSELIIMLNQASTDRLELAKILNISDLQMSYITNVNAGEGLIKIGSSLIPFVNKFPNNTKLYKLMTTKPRRRSSIMKKVLLYIIILLLVSVMLISSYFIFKELKQNKRQDEVIEEIVQITENTEEKENKNDIDLNELYKINNDLIGWIKIENTNINYPVMQSKIKNYYLRKDFYKNYSSYGTPFIAEECEINKSDNIVIYGHNIRGRKMFGDLESYKSKNFFEENKIVDFYTLNGNITDKKQYEIFAVFKTPVYTSNEFKYYNYINFNSEDEFSEFINKCKSKAMYDTNINPKYNDKMITLSTCEYSQRNGRLVVIAKEI